jgi:hypothetical protein
VSIGLGRALPVKRWNLTLCQEDWGYRHLKPTFNRAQISAQWYRRILNEFSLLRLGTVVFMSSTPLSQDLNGFAIGF